MVILLIIWYGYGFGAKTFLTVSNDDEVAKAIAAKMIAYLEFLPTGGRRVWVFDGPNPVLKKRRVIAQAKYRARKVSKAIWLYFLSGKHGHKRLARALWKRFTRPSQHVVQLVMKYLVEAHGATVQVAPGEADHAISRLVASKPSFWVVVSNDSDYLYFTQCIAVINPVKT